MALPALRPHEHKQVALQSALQVLNSGAELDRPDTPDEVVTAVRRLPAVEAAYAPFPAGIDARLMAAFESRGVHQLYTHQAEAFAHVAAGRQVVVTTPTASGKTLCYNLPVLDRILKNPSDARAVPVPDQGAGAGSDGGAARAGRNRSATWAAKRSACTPTTATRRRTRAAPSARARTSSSAIPTWCTRASCRTIRAGRSCSRISTSSSSTNCTRIAACSAAT